MAKRLARFEVKRVGDGWFFHVVAANGQILAHSEVYTRKRSAVLACRAINPALEIKVFQ